MEKMATVVCWGCLASLQQGQLLPGAFLSARPELRVFTVLASSTVKEISWVFLVSKKSTVSEIGQAVGVDTKPELSDPRPLALSWRKSAGVELGKTVVGIWHGQWEFCLQLNATCRWRSRCLGRHELFSDKLNRGSLGCPSVGSSKA